MSRFILGLHAGHNSSACIGDESGIIYAVQEERLCGEKNYWGFPRLAIQACMNRVGATPADLLAVANGGLQVLCTYHSRDDVLNSYRRQETMVGRMRQRWAVPILTALLPNLGQGKLVRLLSEIGLGGAPVVYYDHHQAHAATAFYGLRPSPAEKCLVLTCDGAGDTLCATVRVMERDQDTVIAETHWDNSLGAVYSWITYGMGFVPLEHEYKLMGMAPYASDRAAQQTAEIFHSYLGLDNRGLSFQRQTRQRTNDVYASLEQDLRGRRFDYICAGLQRFTEDLLTQWTQNAVRATGVRRVLAAGGVFMNVKANKRIAELPEVDDFEAFPSCGDETLCLGAYFLEAARQYGADKVVGLKHFYLGDSAEENGSLATVQQSGLRVERPDNMADAVADLLIQGKPVARCAGAMEFGARALCNRSILADPRNQDVVRVINQMVKKRDFWMPFAPVVMESRQQEYLQNPKKLRSPYMMMTFDTRDNFRDLIAAVHNADLTCRAQILAPQQNPEMHEILTAFESKTGRGVVLNTSFNLHGFPIVRTAADALHVLKNSGLEHLQVDSFLVHKE